MATPQSTLPSSCCTCATLLPNDPTTTPSPSYDFSDEKKRPPTPPPEPPRRLPCCSRLICAPCQQENPRFMSYCPFCQISEKRSALPQGLRDPPAYDEGDEKKNSEAPSRKRRSATLNGVRADQRPSSGTSLLADDAPPPAYTAAASSSSSSSTQPRAQTQPPSQPQTHPDTTHHLHASDTLSSLSLSYAVPLPVLRSHNALFSDSLLAARRTLLIPGTHYQGPSLSDTPVESEEERVWKGRLRRFMVRSKCASYEVAEVYLKGAVGSVEKKGTGTSGSGGEQAGVEGSEENQKDEVVEEAVKRWEEDERWEREHPFEKEKGKQGARKRRGFGGSLAGQLR